MLKFEYIVNRFMLDSTNTEPTRYKLLLEAEGTFDDIEWFKKKVDKIGTKDK